MRLRRGRFAVALLLTGALGAGMAVTHAVPADASPSAGVASPAPTRSATPSPAPTRSTAAPSPARTPLLSAAPKPTTTPTPVPTPRPAGKVLNVQVLGGAVLTLPAADGLRDSTRIRVRSGAKGDIDLLAISGKKVVHLTDAAALRHATIGWSRTVTVHVRQLGAGSWTIRARRTLERTVRAKAPAPLVVGSGKPVHVAMRPAQRVAYPYPDGVLDAIDTAVVATDETGLPLPFTGTLLLDTAGKDRSAKLSRAGTAHIAVTGLPLGPAKLVATLAGPAGTTTRSTAVTLAPTGAGTTRVALSADTVQPVVDGLLDTVTFTTTGVAVAGSPAPVSGSLTISQASMEVQRWRVADGTARTFSWDGRVDGVIVPGAYTVTLSLKGPEGLPRTSVRTVLVSNAHLPYRVQDLFTVAAGNQQGLAVHNGIFYVGFDNGDGTARIEEYNGSGAQVGTLGPLATGHCAELSYSTTTNLLYVANGGGTSPTAIWGVDPTTGAVQSSFDLTALGPNGMVAVDDANARLLVFSGTAGAYTVTPVSLNPVSTTDGDGTTTTVPSGTPGASVPIAITGVPQGIELVGQQLWVYTSLKKVNHLAKYDLSGNPVLGPDGSSDLMFPGEGEGLAYDPQDPGMSVYVGAHDANRVGVLVPVPDA